MSGINNNRDLIRRKPENLRARHHPYQRLPLVAARTAAAHLSTNSTGLHGTTRSGHHGLGSLKSAHTPSRHDVQPYILKASFSAAGLPVTMRPTSAVETFYNATYKIKDDQPAADRVKVKMEFKEEGFSDADEGSQDGKSDADDAMVKMEFKEEHWSGADSPDDEIELKAEEGSDAEVPDLIQTYEAGYSTPPWHYESSEGHRDNQHWGDQPGSPPYELPGNAAAWPYGAAPTSRARHDGNSFQTETNLSHQRPAPKKAAVQYHLRGYLVGNEEQAVQHLLAYVRASKVRTVFLVAHDSPARSLLASTKGVFSLEQAEIWKIRRGAIMVAQCHQVQRVAELRPDVGLMVWVDPSMDEVVDWAWMVEGGSEGVREVSILVESLKFSAAKMFLKALVPGFDGN